jgi:hypothetical protein
MKLSMNLAKCFAELKDNHQQWKKHLLIDCKLKMGRGVPKKQAKSEKSGWFLMIYRKKPFLFKQNVLF